jgi:glycosyltransferase involved in cell wall biosynthesis
MPYLKGHYVHAWRNVMGPALNACDAFIVPSPTTRNIICDHYPHLEKSKFKVIEHGHNYQKTFFFSSAAPTMTGPIKVVFFGALAKYKGLQFVEEILQYNRKAGNPIEFHILGTVSLKLDHKQYGVIYYGPYKRKELPQKLARIRPALALLPSLWPETFCYALSEAWAAGIPVLGSSLGAIGDRLRRHGGGWTLYPDDPQQWFEKILEIANSPEDYKERIKEIRSLHLRNTEEMAQDYMRVYQRLLVPVSNKPETQMEPIRTMIN